MGPASASEWNSHSEHGRGQRARGADSRRAGCEIASSFPAVGAATPCSAGADRSYLIGWAASQICPVRGQAALWLWVSSEPHRNAPPCASQAGPYHRRRFFPLRVQQASEGLSTVVWESK